MKKQPTDPKTGKFETVYKEEYAQQLIDHLAKGYSFDSFAGTIGVSKRTVYNWATTGDPGFREDFKQAREIGDAKSRFYFDKLLGAHFVHDKSIVFETKAVMFAMQLRGFAPSPAGLAYFAKQTNEEGGGKQTQTIIIGATEDDI